jgi:hypothetical protein
MRTLPTDEQYLDELYERFKDDEWIRAHEPITTVDSLVEGARLIIQEGLLQPHELQRAVEALREASDPSLLFRGEFIGLLRRVALLRPTLPPSRGARPGCPPIANRTREGSRPAGADVRCGELICSIWWQSK